MHSNYLIKIFFRLNKWIKINKIVFFFKNILFKESFFRFFYFYSNSSFFNYLFNKNNIYFLDIKNYSFLKKNNSFINFVKKKIRVKKDTNIGNRLFNSYFFSFFKKRYNDSLTKFKKLSKKNILFFLIPEIYFNEQTDQYLINKKDGFKKKTIRSTILSALKTKSKLINIKCLNYFNYRSFDKYQLFR